MQRPPLIQDACALALGALVALAAAQPAATAPRLPRAAAGDTIPGAKTPAAPAPAGARRPPPARGDTARTPGTPPAPGATRDTTPAAPEPDAVFDQLLKLEGYTPVQYKGTDAQFTADSAVLVLRGEAEVARAGQTLTADTIVYQDRSKVATAFGDPKVSGEGQNIEGEVLVYDLERRVALVEGGRTQYASGATWYVRGDKVAAEQETNRLYAEGTTFTSDEREEPQYHFRAGKTKVVRDRLLVGRPAVLYFRNVPVAWLPFIVQDMEKGRRSGILTPRFGINDIVRTSSGYQRQISNVGYYWAINQYMGSQLSGEWRSNSYTSLTGTLDFNWRRRFLNGSASWRQYFPDDGARQRTLAGNASWKPDERTNLAFQGSYASSSDYVRRRSIDPLEATQDLTSSFSLDRRFDWGQVNLGAQRRQSLGNDRVEWTLPNFGITPNTITLFRSAVPEQARWYNDVVVTLAATGSQSGIRVPFQESELSRTFRSSEERRGQFQLSNTIRVGDLSLSNNASLNRNAAQGFQAGSLLLPTRTDTLSFANDQGQWNSSISYQQNLIGSTFIAPTLALTQEFRRDTASLRLAGDGYVAGPVRSNFGASLNTDLFGFFPGVGGIERIRHHIRPGLSYRYSPKARSTELQDSVFGVEAGETQNRLSLTLDQTFEARMRSPSRRSAADTASDSTRAAGDAPPTPQDARKVTLLAINASALEYDFARASRGKNGFVSDQVSGSIRSDFLQGLTIQFGVDLFGDPSRRDSIDSQLARDPLARGAFAPQLSTLSTGFTLGQNSAIFRFLGFGRRRGTDESMTPGDRMVPGGDSVQAPGTRPGTTTSTANPQQAGGGPWSMNVNYALVRPRPNAFSGFGGGGENQTLNGTLAFSPTRNWAVNWGTSYNVTDAEFGAHSLTLVRDLYRWQANFSFYRTPVGNTSFQFSVHLKDLPDLKVDYNERDIGVDRRQ